MDGTPAAKGLGAPAKMKGCSGPLKGADETSARKGLGALKNEKLQRPPERADGIRPPQGKDSEPLKKERM